MLRDFSGIKIEGDFPMRKPSEFDFSQVQISPQESEFDFSEIQASEQKAVEITPQMKAVQMATNNEEVRRIKNRFMNDLQPNFERLGFMRTGGLGQDIKESFIEQSAKAGERGMQVREDVSQAPEGEKTKELIKGIWQTAGEFAGTIPAITDPVFERLTPIVESIGESFDFSDMLDEDNQESLKKLQENIDVKGGEVLNSVSEFSKENPELIANIKPALQIGLSALELYSGRKGGGVLKESLEEGVVASKVLFDKAPTFKSLINKSPEDAVEVLKKAEVEVARFTDEGSGVVKKEELSEFIEETSKQIKKETDKIKLTPEEIRIGITPQIKRRLQSNPNKFVEYVEYTKNAREKGLDTSPMAFATENVDKTIRKVEESLNNKGSEIGKFREQIAKNKVPLNKKTEIENTYDDLLNNLNVERVIDPETGEIIIREIEGEITNLSPSDMKKLGEFWNDLSKVQNMKNLIDFRNKVRSQVRFGKQANEVSDVLDTGFARPLQGKVKDINAELIGKDQAQKLEDYSNLLSLIEDYGRLSSKGKNNEFLLKRVLSERGRPAKETLDKIKEITGNDLVEDAIYARIATEILGTPEMKGLFRQEIKNAGIDVFDFLSGDKLGLLQKVIKSVPREIKIRQGVDPDYEEALNLIQKYIDTSKGITPKSRNIKSGVVRPKAIAEDLGFVKKADDVPTPKTSISPELLEEAKKYKSAEEFIETQGEPVYHAGSEIITVPRKGDVLYVSPSRLQAEGFGVARKTGNKLSEFRLNPNAKVKEIDFVTGQKLKGILADARDEGIDVVKYKEMGINEDAYQWTYAILNPEQIKTKSQLEEIWKQANNLKK